MNSINVVAIALIIAGALGLAYGSFTYTKKKRSSRYRPLGTFCVGKGNHQRSCVGWRWCHRIGWSTFVSRSQKKLIALRQVICPPRI